MNVSRTAATSEGAGSVEKPVDSLRARTLKGLFWQTLARGGDRIARLLTNLILARLLLPEDFGLMGVVAAALAPLDAITFLASEQVIVQNPNSRRREFLDTTFWLTSVRGLLIGVIWLLLAPLAAKYFKSPNAVPLFCAMALQPVLQGLFSPRVHLLVKDMRFNIWSTYRLVCSVVGMGASIGLAVWLRSAWALLIGQLVMVGAQALGSHVVAPFLPRLRFDRASWRELRAYGLQAAGTPLLVMLVLQAPAFILGRFGGLEVFGVFFLTQRLLDLPTGLSQQVVGSVAMPAYSSIQNDAQRVARAWLTVLTGITSLSLPLAVAFAWTGAALPQAVYGSAYSPAVGVVALLAAGSGIRSISAVTGPLFWALGRPSYDRTIQGLRTLLLYPLGTSLTQHYRASGMALAMLLSSTAAAALTLWTACRTLPCAGPKVWQSLRGSVTCAMFLLAVLLLLDQLVQPQGVARLVVAAACTGLVVALHVRTARDEVLLSVVRSFARGVH